MKFYLVRHGEKLKIKGDPNLSSIGKQQAELTGKYFATQEVTQIITGPLIRTIETAEIISKEIKVNYQIDERLRERLNWGDEQNQSFEEFLKEWEKTTEDRNYKPKIGLSSTEAGNNLISVMQDTKELTKNGNVILVTSGGIITDALRNLFGDDFLLNKNFNFINDVRECSITTLEITDKKFNLLEFGSTSHLTSTK